MLEMAMTIDLSRQDPGGVSAAGPLWRGLEVKGLEGNPHPYHTSYNPSNSIFQRS